MVSHTSRASVGTRDNTGENRAERGYRLPQTMARWVTSINGRPMRQPIAIQTATTPACESANSGNQACG